jgi:outer membrane murein-binding lipoprotein Lpp
MKILIVAALVTSLSGCASIKTWVPSFWDDNQSAKIVDVRQSVEQLDCSQDQLAQVSKIRSDLQWFELYSESKGWRQKDVLRVIAPMQETVEDMYKRAQGQQGSKVYCELKKRVMQEQAKRAAEAVLGRF